MVTEYWIDISGSRYKESHSAYLSREDCPARDDLTVHVCLASELAALKERHAADVEAAFKEGLNTGRSPFNLLDADAVFGHRQWKESRAKKVLAESEGE